MTLSNGSRLGSYEIIAGIGVGGMGEVYRATDTKLKRDVAIKVLPESFATDAERLARFQREAELLASLNHPNIAQIFGLEKADGITALIMELIEGPTLAERIEQGPVPPDDALTIALQIADALEAAHERGIVHRDLKPANIKLKPDGRVKVLDFGIAKAMDNQTGNSGPQSPMLTTPAMTQSGMILGTAAYMSPEQARGKTVDRRADIWAFGCVLYEMLTGQPAFGGEDVPLTLARVLSQATDLHALPKSIAPAFSQCIELCLEKDPKKRLADISDVRLVLKGRFEKGSQAGAATAVVHPLWRRLLPLTGAVLAGGIVFGLTAWNFKPAPPPLPQPVNRFAYAIPGDHQLRNIGRNVLAVSPDGRHFAYNTSQGLFLRELGQLEARLIAGTGEVLATPIFSPDGQSLLYFAANDLSVKRIAISGGAPVILADQVNESPRDASWAADNTIFYSQPTGIFRLPANGGNPELIIAVEAGQGFLYNPELLPDGDTLLFTAGPRSGNTDAGQIVAQSLSTGERTVLMEGGMDPHYLPTGHLLYALGDGLFAVTFDLATLTVSGAAVPLVQGLMRAEATSNYGVAADGTLFYLSGTSASGFNSLVWVNRDGSETPVALEPGSYVYPRISPDGRRVALSDLTPVSGIWVWDFNAETRTRLTIGEAGGTYTVWTADGARIAYGAGSVIDWKAANNTGQVTRMTEFVSTGTQGPSPYFFSPSGQELVFRNQATPGTNDDIAMITVGGTAEPVFLLNETYIERNAELSPDGRWMAYQSDESGQFEIYVRPFPNVDDDRVQVSNAGGMKPLWSRDGRELFYLQVAGSTAPAKLISVAVQAAEAAFVFGARTLLMDWPYFLDGEGRNYDVALDGQRFLAFQTAGAADEAIAPQVIVIQNWTEELKRLVPVE